MIYVIWDKDTMKMRTSFAIGFGSWLLSVRWKKFVFLLLWIESNSRNDIITHFLHFSRSFCSWMWNIAELQIRGEITNASETNASLHNISLLIYFYCIQIFPIAINQNDRFCYFSSEKDYLWMAAKFLFLSRKMLTSRFGMSKQGRRESCAYWDLSSLLCCPTSVAPKTRQKYLQILTNYWFIAFSYAAKEIRQLLAIKQLKISDWIIDSADQ